MKITSSVPNKMRILTSNSWKPLLTSSSKATSPSWLIQSSSGFSKITATTRYLTETDVKDHKTSVGRPSAAFPNSLTCPTEETLSCALFQSMFGSIFGASKAKTFLSLTEKSAFPSILKESANALDATNTLKNVGTVVKRSSNSLSNYYTWSPSGNSVNMRSEVGVSAKSTRENVQHTLRRGRQTPLVHASLISVTPVSQGFSSNHSADRKTKAAMQRADTVSSNHPLTNMNSIFISLSVKNPTLLSNSFTESLTSSTLYQVTSRPTLTGYMARNTSYDNISSNKISSSSWSQQMTVTWQLSSSQHYASVASRKVSLPSNASWRGVTSRSSSSFNKNTVSSQSTLATPHLSELLLSTTKVLGISTIPPKTISQGIWRAVGTSSTLPSSPLKKGHNGVAGNGTINSTELGGALSVHSTSKRTLGISVTWKRRKDSSKAVLLKNKSMANLDPYSSISLVAPNTAVSTEALLLNLITQDCQSTNKDGSTTRTPSKTPMLLPITVQSVTKAISQGNTSIAIDTNPTLLRSSVTIQVDLSSSVFVSFPISSFSSNLDFRSVPTVTSEVKGSNNDSAQTLRFSFMSTASDSSTVASKLTLKPKTSLSSAEKPSSFLSLDSTGGLPFGTSSFHNRTSTERSELSLLQYYTPSVLTTKRRATFSHTLLNAARDSSLHSNFATTTGISFHSSSTRLAMSTTEMTSKKLNSLIVNVRLPIVTSSILGKSKVSIQESLSRYKTPSFATTTLQSQMHISHASTNSEAVRISITTVSAAIKPASLLQTLLSFASGFTIGVSNNVKSNGSLGTHSPHPKANSTTSFVLVSNYTSTLQVTRSRETVPYRFSSALTTAVPISNVTLQPPGPFKVMDGSLIIRNINYHTNLSNPETTMFKIRVLEVEAIIRDIISLNNTDILDVEVTSFRNGSVLADFYLKVRYDSPLSDQEYAQILSAANKTLWRGFYVTNITVTLRTRPEGTSAPSQEKDDASLQNTVIIATLTVLGVLLIAVGSFGVYVCKKKGVCHISKVKPVE